jgi:phage gp46-like protein
MDIRIVASATLQETVADWNLMPSGLLDEREELANYVKVALMTDRTASLDEVLPDPDSTDYRGWWGDMDAKAIWNGWQIGTKNWLLTRAKITPPEAWEHDTVSRAENYTRDALQPMIDLRMCSAIDVQAARVAIDRIDVYVAVYRGPRLAVELIFQDLWNKFVNVKVQSPYGAGL